MGTHPRNTGPMLASRRCGAKTRSGEPCRSLAVSGKARCRMHGGARDRALPAGTKTRSSMDVIRMNALRNVSRCERLCAGHSNCFDARMIGDQPRRPSLLSFSPTKR